MQSEAPHSPPQDKTQYKFTKPELGGGGGGGGCPAQLLPARGYLRLKASLFKILAATLEHFLSPALDSSPTAAPRPASSVSLMTSILHVCDTEYLNINWPNANTKFSALESGAKVRSAM